MPTVSKKDLVDRIAVGQRPCLWARGHDDTLEEPVQKIALQIANARLWEDAEKQKEAEK